MTDEQATQQESATATDAAATDAETIDAPETTDTVEQADVLETTNPAETGDVPGANTARTPEFTPVREPAGHPTVARSLGSVFDVSVTLTAELGRSSMPISDLLHLGEGSVIELNRPVSAPVDVRAQGVLLARGEVVVVDDCFAVRLKEVTQPAAFQAEGNPV